MQSIQTQTIIRAVKMLTAAGAKFKVISTDGTEYGELVAVEPSSEKRTRADRSTVHEALRIKDRVMNMKVGDVEVFTLTEELAAAGNITIGKLQALVSGNCQNLLGKGCVSTHRNGNSIEVLRIE